jgi:hypothetical protein
VVGTSVALGLHLLAILFARFLPDGALKSRDHDFFFAIVVILHAFIGSLHSHSSWCVDTCGSVH